MGLGLVHQEPFAAQCELGDFDAWLVVPFFLQAGLPTAPSISHQPSYFLLCLHLFFSESVLMRGHRIASKITITTPSGSMSDARFL